MKRQASVQDISWFIDLDSVNRLDLTPPYQRRSVWTATDRRFFLDTIFRNYPCPAIFIHKTINENGVPTYHIVDGKQRLETILNFVKNKIAIAKDYGDERLDGKRFKDLSPEMKRIFWNYSVPVDFIEIPDDLDINGVFDRVNRNSRNLERQELRHARYSGWFITESEQEADEDRFWELVKVTSKAKAKRMKNVQFVSELLMIIILEDISGFDQNQIDEIYARYDNLDDNENFDLDEYIATKNRVKAYIEDMERHNHCITTYAKTNVNLYSLFALITLTKIETPAAVFAESYSGFMEKVNAFKTSSELDSTEESTDEDEIENPNIALLDGDVDNDAFKYYTNSRGANTEPPQRAERHKALLTLLTQ